MRAHNITRLRPWCTRMSYLHAVMSACRAEACNKAKGWFDLSHVDVFLHQNCTVEMTVGCMEICVPEWDGTTLPAQAKVEKGKKNTSLLLGYSNFPINPQELLSLLAEAVFLSGRGCLSHTEGRNCPWKAGQVLRGSVFSQQEISFSFCYAKALVPKLMFVQLCDELLHCRCSEGLVSGLK